MENKTPNNICCVCKKPIHHWFHAQGMRCGDPKCEEKFIKMFTSFNGCNTIMENIKEKECVK